MKTKLLSLFVALVATTALWAYDCVVDGIYYNLNTTEMTATVTNETGGLYAQSYSGTVIIPSSFTYNSKTYSVTTIGNYAFYGCDGLISITIPNSVTTIEHSTFYGCISLPIIDNLRYADTYLIEAVQIDIALSTCTIKDGTRWIGEWAFMGCSGLTSVSIPNSVTSIGNNAFYGCSGLTSVSIPNSVTTIGEDTFAWCRGLTSVTIGTSVTTIGNNAFAYCSGLTLLTIPNSVTTIGESAFSGCTGLTSVTIPNSVTKIGDDVFYNCSSLTSVTIPNSVITIGARAFAYCDGLTLLTIPNSVTTIGEMAFSGCRGLTSITIPNSVTTIGNNAFYGCSGLTSINVDAANPHYCSIDGVLFNSAKDTLIQYPISNTRTEYSIPNSVKTIGEMAFSGCRGLTSITIPNSVTTIGNNAFYGCSGLTSVSIPNSVTTIGSSAFGECSGLTSVSIPNSVTTIGNGAFSACYGLTSVTIPNSVTTIGNGAFSACYGLTSVTIGTSVTTIGESAFESCKGLTSVTIGNSVTTIGDYAFKYCSGLTSITIPNSVTTIGEEAFYMVNNIVYSGFATGWPWGAKCVNGYVDGYLVYSDASKTTLCGCSTAATGEIIIPNSVTTIGEEAFYECSGLTSVTIGNSVTTIGEEAFYECSGLTSVTIGNSVTTIGDDAFKYCSGLTLITIGNSVTTIGNYAFAWCSGLTSLILPNSVTTIGNYAFAYCSGLTSIELPFSTTAIEKYAFNNIYNLSIIYYNDKITELLQSIIGTRHSIDYRGVKAEITNLSPSTLSISNTANTDKDVIASWKLNVNKQTYLPDNSDDILCTGLNPQTAYDCVQMIQLAGESEWLEDCHFSVTTPELTLTTLTPKIVSAGTAIVAAETNISDYETNVGFEWRKYDAPSSMPSKSGTAILYNGMMEGKLLNLGTDAYWNVRPYYEAADGTRYYGEWITFDPSDFSYFEPTVHTYTLATSPTSNAVQVRGYVMTGTDDVTEQGFEYWFKGGQKAPHRAPAATPDSIYRVTASGQVMSAVLEDLAYSSTYTCRAYAIAGGKTYYGEEVQFLTPEDPRPIYTLTVIAGENGSVNTEVSGQYREGEQVTLTATPNVGYLFEQWSDGNTENPYILTIMQDTEITATFKQAESGLINLHSDIRVSKYFHNGNLIIERNGIKYTSTGQKVR